jgi:hypothetical protein
VATRGTSTTRESERKTDWEKAGGERAKASTAVLRAVLGKDEL